MRTYIELYEELRANIDIKKWLKDAWKGKDKQESLLRLFGHLGLISKLDNFNICKGNFNKMCLTNDITTRDIFYEGTKKIKLKDTGDASDLSGISKDNKIILATTSKNLSGKYNIEDLDIDKILCHFGKYKDKDYKLQLCICVRRSGKLIKVINNIKESSRCTLGEYLDNVIIIDWLDLQEAYNKFINIYRDIDINDLLDNDKSAIILKLHQRYSVSKTMKLLSTGNKQILWGHIPRSGKSYIMAGTIIEHPGSNYLIITTAPNETIKQYIDVMNCIQLKDYNVTHWHGSKKIYLKDNNNIIICSKQYLQSKVSKSKIIKELSNLNFSLRFIDESHNGGTTELAQNILNIYGKESPTIYITATYTKPVNDFNIPKKDWILWDLEDVKLCQLPNEYNIKQLQSKHGSIFGDILGEYTYTNIINEYTRYPNLIVLTQEINEDTINYIKENTKNNSYGWSTEACFLLKSGNKEFQNEDENLKLWFSIFGKKDKYGIPHKDYPDSLTMMGRINNIECLGKYSSRKSGSVIMCFLPQNNIEEISLATKNLLETHKVILNYNIVILNSKRTNDPKRIIEEGLKKATLEGKKGVVVLSGRQCSLGVTIHGCDIVIMLNNTSSSDMLYQMMFRCMTEASGKSCGYVIDMNIHRSIHKYIVEYANILKPELGYKKAVRYLLKERIVNLNPDHWEPSFRHLPNKMDDITNQVIDVFKADGINAISNLLSKIKFIDFNITDDEQSYLNTLIKSKKEAKNNIKEEYNSDLKKGIERDTTPVDTTPVDTTPVDTTPVDTTPVDIENKKKYINYNDILNTISALVCFLTIQYEEYKLSKLLDIISNDNDLNDIFVYQVRIWWGDILYDDLIYSIKDVCKNHVDKIESFNNIIKLLKEVLISNLTNSDVLSELVDKYLVPHETEKKQNAEVTTPYKLRQEMLNKMPQEYWADPENKTFEPCCGKGGFVLDIVNRYMGGLKSKIKNEKKRRKHVLENCIYFADINKTNIYITKLLLDPFNQYDLKFHQGDTLKLDIKKKWKLDGFNAVIGNPPYNASGNTGTGNTIWQNFVKEALNRWITKNGYLCYVHPPGWRKPNTEKSRFYGLYELMVRKNYMIYLSIHGIKDGIKTFGCGTRYDWYLIQRSRNEGNKTNIDDEKGIVFNIDMNDFHWIPNYNIMVVQKLLAIKEDERCPIIYNRSNYGSDKPYISKTINSEYKYPLIHTIPKTGIRYMYSNINNKGHFGIPKVIFGDNGLNDVIIDMKGKYGMTEQSMGIEITSNEHGNKISQSLQSDKFREFLKGCIIGNFRIDWRLFRYLKKDFWKEFI